MISREEPNTADAHSQRGSAHARAEECSAKATVRYCSEPKCERGSARVAVRGSQFECGRVSEQVRARLVVTWAAAWHFRVSKAARTRPECVCSNSKAAAGNGSSDQKVMPGGEGGNERERERQKAIKSQSVGQCDRGSAG